MRFKLITLIMVVMKTEFTFFNSNKIKGNEELVLLILNCNLLYDQIEGWTMHATHFTSAFLETNIWSLRTIQIKKIKS